MIKYFTTLFLLAISNIVYAGCSDKQKIIYGPVIEVDISDAVTNAIPEWTGTFNTNYGNNSFNCTTSSSKFGYTATLSSTDKYATIIGFSNGKYRVRAEIIDTIDNKTLNSSGTHYASELNTTFMVKFSLTSREANYIIDGDTVRLEDVLFVTDLSSMSFLDIILWPGKQILKITQWILSGFKNWPYDNNDMFGQPMNITYKPKETTCYVNNASLSITLPLLGRSQVLKGNFPGYTPFMLGIQCEHLVPHNGDRTNRNIDIFLSSNNLHPSDATTLIDTSTDAAKGIGLRLLMRNTPTSPITLSPSNSQRGNATSLFFVPENGLLQKQFMIPMAVYYHPWSPENLTQGVINTTATLNITYP